MYHFYVYYHNCNRDSIKLLTSLTLNSNLNILLKTIFKGRLLICTLEMSLRRLHVFYRLQASIMCIIWICDNHLLIKDLQRQCCTSAACRRKLRKSWWRSVDWARADRPTVPAGMYPGGRRVLPLWHRAYPRPPPPAHSTPLAFPLERLTPSGKTPLIGLCYSPASTGDFKMTILLLIRRPRDISPAKVLVGRISYLHES